MVECDRLSCKVGLTTETQHHPPIILHVVCWVALRLTQPCILREVVDRPNLGRKRPLRSKGHHHNLPDKTRTVAGVVAKTINC